jgi:Flp pilus assembly pilin Flp
MLRLATAVQAILLTLRERARRAGGERGAHVVEYALIAAAVVGIAIALAIALKNRAEPAIGEIGGG